MSRKVNSLQSNLSHQTPESLCAPSSVIPLGPGSTTSATSFSGEDWLVLSDFDVNQNRSWSLGDVVLGYQNVSELLHFYALHYYDHLPILDKVTSISALHDPNHLLFWTVLRVACYRHPRFSHVFELSWQPYRLLLMSHLVAIIHDFRTIQAIVILCHWPNSGPRQSQDPSWQYCGIALNAAMQMGMDQPHPEKISPGFHGRSNVHQMSVYSRHMTWLACFHISTSLSVWLGVPPHLSSPAQLNAISSTAKEPDVPQQLMVQIEIQRQVVQYSTSLAGDVDAGTASTLLNLFNNELDNLYNAFREIWSSRLEIQLLGAKLYLFSLCLTVVTRRPGRMAEHYVPDPSRLPVQLGLPTAVSLIHNISKLNRESSLEPRQSASGVIHYPKFYFRLVVFAVGFLMKFLSTNPNASQEDRELAISHIMTAHQFFSSFPTGEDFARVAQAIEVLAKNLRSDKQDDSDPIRTRSGASLLYDIFQKFRGQTDRVGGDDNTTITGAPIEPWKQIDDASRTTSLGTMNPGTSTWASAGTYGELSSFQPGLEESLDNLQWMSDDMLSEMFRM
ncbi:hypothetical protein A1O7_07263 [Cladophialophora yegresii CBS 114405]|uniref:Xylanolytic transcriptional activator regulatory domain-containing protein n=1 Tax=Cladophialophora yegresii CBS 114405 TaxID=1182544 RepID=W9WEH1_9EURO|nr:uncharacterized protein A1O7_07263 [Cladophialophora yegresii CBS 114405]EXJ56919.1 hypothetical protein A1O7_07263 [Cladophialophora yegresii CBS 114405]